MIPRYSLPEVSKIFSEENKFKLMLDIELLAAAAQSQYGIVPKSSVARMKRRAKFNVKRIQDIEKKTHHDIVAFLTEECCAAETKYAK